MIAYLNGTFLPLEDARLPVWDYGFTMGVAISEQIRTYHGRLPLLKFHLERLSEGMEIVGIKPEIAVSEIGQRVHQVVEKNLSALTSGNDLSIGIVVTPGDQTNRAPLTPSMLRSFTLLITALPLPCHTWAQDYENGIELITAETREIPSECLPKALKCRSRMHYYLAEQQARRQSPLAKALLLDLRGFVAEGTIASVLAVRDQTIVAPPETQVLPSVSVRFLETQLCPAAGIPFQRTELTVSDLLTADEVWWLSTSSCMLPVASINGHAIGSTDNRQLYSKFISSWSTKMDVDIVQQAIRNRDQQLGG